MVESGPIMPACAAAPAPMRSIAIITSSTGTAVQNTALSTDRPSTSGATSAAESGRNTTNWAMQHTHATVVARPTSRSEPTRRTISPL